MRSNHRDSSRPRSGHRKRNSGTLILITTLTIALGIGVAVGITKSGALAAITPQPPTPTSTAHAGRGAPSTARLETTPTASPSATPSHSPKATAKPIKSTASPSLTSPTRSAGRGASEASLETTPSQSKTPHNLPLSKNPYDLPSQQLAAQRSTASATTIALLQRIASQPIADWYGGSTSSVRSSVTYRVQAAAAQHKIAQLVVYNLPNRDCEGGYSASTLTADQYRTWFKSFVAGLGSRKAIVILEPDALMQMSCLTAAQQSERYSLMSWATSLLHAQGSWTYIDAGHSAGISGTATASRLRRAGVANAAGFSLNVSGFRSDAESIAYGTAISKRVGGKHFLIDSSRNGVSPKNADWCNPSGKGLGHAPTTSTGVPLLDAYLWVKTPGSSDGSCNGGSSSGAWFQSYALMLARNAHLG